MTIVAIVDTMVRTRNSKKTSKEDWLYIGRGTKSVDAPQKASAGDIVESDFVIIDDKGNALGSQFKLDKVEGGHVYGSIARQDGSVFEVKKTCGHVFVPIMTGNSKRRRTKSVKQMETTESNTKKPKKASKKKVKTAKVNKPFKAPDAVQRETRNRKNKTVNLNKEVTSLKEFEGLAEKSTVTDVDAAKVKTKDTQNIDNVETTKVQQDVSDRPPPKVQLDVNARPPPKVQLDENTVPPCPTPFGSYHTLAQVKKARWIHSDSVIQYMQTYVPDFPQPSQWTIRRLLMSLIKKFNVHHKKGDNTENLARTLDFFVANKGNTDVDDRKQRWSANLDFGRLLMLMFGTTQAKAEYVASRQLPSRQQLDDTTKKSLKVQYWIKIAQRYCDPDLRVEIDVGYDIVNLYLCEKLSSKFRVPWSANKLREHFRDLRADYEGSVEYQNYVRSGQNNDSFYPDFQKSNPTHVMLHYLLRDVPHGAVLGDMPVGTMVDTNDTNKPDEDKVEVNLVTPEKSHPPPVRNRGRSSRSVSPARTNSPYASKDCDGVAESTQTFTKSCEQLVKGLQRSFAASNARNSKLDSVDLYPLCYSFWLLMR